MDVIDAYQIIEAETRTALHREVREKLRKGWKPQGGVCVWKSQDGNDWYAQAMIQGH